MPLADLFQRCRVSEPPKNGNPAQFRRLIYPIGWRNALACAIVAMGSVVAACERQPDQTLPGVLASEAEVCWASRITGVSARIRGEVNYRDLMLIASAADASEWLGPEQILEGTLGDRVVWSRPARLLVWGTPTWRAAVGTWPTSDSAYSETRVWGETLSMQWESLAQVGTRFWPRGQFPDRYARADFTDQAQFLYMAPDPRRQFPALLSLTEDSGAIQVGEPQTVPLLGGMVGDIRYAYDAGPQLSSISLLVFSEPKSNSTCWILVTGGSSAGDSYLVLATTAPVSWPLNRVANPNSLRTLYPDEFNTYLPEQLIGPLP